MSEYRQYLVAVQRWLPVWLIASVVAAGSTFGVMSRLPTTYFVHFSYLVSLAEREQGPDYTFDGFYALQATDLFTATLAQWIEAPELIVEAYREANLPLPTDNVRRLGRSIVAQKTAPQLITATVAGQDTERTERLAKALVAVTKRNVALYHQEGTPALTFNVVATEPWTSVERPNVAIVVGSVFAVTLLLLINIQLVWMSSQYARRG